MKKRLALELVTPEKPALSEQADFVALPALEGEMGVLPGHAPFLVQLKPGEVRVRSGDQTRNFAVSGGFAEIQGDKVAIFAETAEIAEQIDAERARQALEKAKAEAKRADPLTLAQAEASMRLAEVQLRIAKLRRLGVKKRK